MKYYVYIYKDPSKNNEPIYVGKGSGNRFSKHLSSKKKHPFKHRLDLMKRNGVKPIIEIIEVGTNEKFAYDIEICLIKKIGRKIFENGPLLNISPGGENPPNHKGKKRTLEQKKKYSEAQKGNKNCLGRVLSDETKEKLSKKHKGKKLSEEHKKKLSLAHLGQKAWNKGLTNKIRVEI